MFVLAILFVLVGITLALVLANIYEGEYKKASMPTFLGCLLLAFVFFFISILAPVSTGHTGILTTFGKVENGNLDAGLNFKAPWQSVVQMDNRVQIREYELSCFSADIQEVSVSYRVNFQINKQNAAQIYRTLGINYADTILEPRVQEAVKAIVAKYTAETLVANREQLSEQIEDVLVNDASQYNIEVVATAISNIDFTDAFTNAVEAKQVAAQNKLRAQTEQEQKTMEQKQTAERAKIQAEADAEVAKTKANADAEVAKIAAQADLEVQKINADAAEYTGQKEAAKNEAISKSITPELIEYFKALNWDGKLPVVNTDGSGMFLDVSDIVK